MESHHSFSENVPLKLASSRHGAPVHKSGRKMDVTNYRGVNMMPNLAKVFERVVFLQLKLIVPRNIDVSQHKFLPN